ncbi:transcription factor IBH1-like 1 [Henckelia pumila]|uniref:transcription factor IBH1-like 1 n=1 Tax=Henckelia pumila TaxID=405737 RepID=UPI003C6E1261
MKARMQNSSVMMKQEFLKKWIKGLQLVDSKRLNKNSSILERRKAIKLSADIAMASTTRNSSSRWSRALIAKASMDGSNKTLIEKISGREAPSPSPSFRCTNKILKRSRGLARAKIMSGKKSRTRVLKKLVPGGEQMDEISLIKETIDYILSLRVQVHVMGRMATAADRLFPFKTTSSSINL